MATYCLFLKISHGVPEAEIAIITPYQAQVAHLSALLRDEFPGLVCGSVDGMQGQEREVSSRPRCRALCSNASPTGGRLESRAKQS